MRLAIGIVADTVAMFRDLVVRAEDAGFDSITCGDNPSLTHDPYVMLSVAAAATRRARLGVAVTNPVTRRPDVTASAISTVAELAPGRVWLGIGSGPARVGSRPLLETYVETLRALWSAGTAEFDHVALNLVKTRSPVPIVLAAAGPRGLRQAGRIADGVIVEYGATPEAVEVARAAIARGAREVGRDPAEIECWWYLQAECRRDGVGTSDIGAALASSAMHAFGRGVDAASRQVPPELVESIRELVARYSRASHIDTAVESPNARLVRELGVAEYLAERFAVVGTPDEVRRRFAELRSMGIEAVFIPGTQQDLGGFIDVMGEDVL